MARRAAEPRPSQRLGTDEARKQLPRLVKRAARLRRPARSLFKNAVEIGPRRTGGALLIPEVDVQAAMEREARLTERIEQLEQEVEDILLGMLLRDRLEQPTADGVPIEEVARKLGFEEELRARE